MRKYFRNTFFAFFVVALVVTFTTPQTGYAETSKNFEFNVGYRDDGAYATKSSGKRFEVTFKKPVKYLSFAAVLDDYSKKELPLKLYFRIEEKLDNGRTHIFKDKKIKFSYIGERDSSEGYTQTIDPGTYYVYVSRRDGSVHPIEGNGYFYYDYE
ncbi:hypothetical protein WJ0W_001440 [Paenibacillus melissococcoides]|uniref:Uncharacterized protein n=1 Tax=Paenibacillus melissococcoides TaxID=2912268 RepID=A0ABM9FYV5_9BACL|nr:MULTISPECIES: hypothetical protein [Paenibacillus]GIO77741.1 hypothetical protein J6TS7_13510 [Paenibacillus dendritiformis]CAH8244202.1 hypothetical protein WJ0W_001440 [Paenibacillus melissococcoides]CAH8703667.1 hypothetical protein HTL2_000224 [Paenibacillus melissococcoides]CAH8706155.1 hypothetical protein WDD9_001186 [Paenibacillus melissococcoides]